MNINVTKRNGRVTPFDAEKINEVLENAAEGLEHVSASHIAMKAELHLYDGIKTEDIQAALIEAAKELTTADTPNYNIAAGRLAIYDIRKHVYGQFEPLPFLQIVTENVQLGKYASHILEDYSKEEIEELGEYIDHERDLFLAYPSVVTWRQKYLIRDRTKDQLFESPQVAIMLIGMCAHASYPDKTARMRKIKKLYDAVSLQKISLPTPIMAGVRSPTKQYSSCTVIDAADNLDSINSAGNAIVKYASMRAGIGINGGRIRALGSAIRNGEATHTGVTNFYKKWYGDLNSCSQGGLRNTAATLYFQWWHYEVESMLVLKNNKGIESNRIRELDYGFQMNRFFLERVKQRKNIALFSPHDVEGLYEAFFKDQDEFARLYEKYEQDPSIRKKVINALDLMTLFATERANTGRVYPMFVDHTNHNGAFNREKAPIYLSNLCLEIALPTGPLSNINDEPLQDGAEIALCTLAAFNLGNVESHEFEELAMIIVDLLDSILDYQDYPVKSAEAAKGRRALGVGVVNFAYWLAKNGGTYKQDEYTRNITHSLFEKIQYSLIKASVELAKERGACSMFGDTSYVQGLMPIDRYQKTVDSLVSPVYNCDWDSLREDVLKYGMRNSTLSALMPSETSSLLSGATNGIEPPRGPVTVKGAKDGSYKVIVPEYANLKGVYDFLWNIGSNRGYLDLVAIMQKFVDQAISANTNYDPSRYENKRVPLKEIIGDIFYAYKHGLKTLYYHNTRDGSGKDEEEEVMIAEDDSCSSGACKI